MNRKPLSHQLREMPARRLPLSPQQNLPKRQISESQMTGQNLLLVLKRQRRPWERGRSGSNLRQWNFSPSIHCASCLFRFLVQWGRLKKKKKKRTGASDLTGTAFCEPGELDPVHTRPEEFEDAALFLQLNLPSTLIRHENETFRFGESKNFLKTITTR